MYAMEPLATTSAGSSESVGTGNKAKLAKLGESPIPLATGRSVVRRGKQPAARHWHGAATPTARLGDVKLDLLDADKAVAVG